MEKESGRVEFRGFPYNPYPIQIDFMEALYRSLDQGGVSLLESPTGTGKTLSIICSALQWVFDQRQKEGLGKRVVSDQNHKGEGQIGSDDEPDWLRNFVVDNDNLSPDKNNKKKLGFKKSDKQKKGLVSGDFKRGDRCGKKENGCFRTKNDGMDLYEEEFLLEDYESEEEGGSSAGKSMTKRKGVAGNSIPSSSDEEEEDGSDEEEKGLKIFFCSRTHSQLSQFIKELNKTAFANEITAVCLGSRKNFCINEEVLKLGNSARINERCLELQRSRKDGLLKIKKLDSEGKIRQTKATCGCPMLRKHKLQRQFKSEASQEVALDIEDLVRLGKSIGTCPYYGSRSMIPRADLLVLPYQSLLLKSSRESLGLKLKDNIVIIDEAHNLADSLIGMYDAKVTALQLDNVHSQIERYFARFCNLLGPGNRRYIQTLMVLTRAFLQTLRNENDSSSVNTCQEEEKFAEAKAILDTSMAINEFLFSLNIDNINLVKLIHYLKESNFVHKISGYGEKIASLQRDFTPNNREGNVEEDSILSSFQAFVSMLISLTNSDGDGRIIISKNQSTYSGKQEGSIKYIMLTGEKIFSEIVNEAHAVILAGGTLQPIEEIRERLFPKISHDKLHFFSCGHIVPSKSILPIAVPCGPSGRSFDFSYGSRSSSIVIEELGLLLCNLATVVPEGIVVFFSSFEYETQVYNLWKTSGILERIMKKKRIFREPRKTNDTELILKEYKETIDGLSLSGEDGAQHRGAVLLAVVGGKISEGINFSDGMGRCIVMVGLPYPNPSDVELMERVKYIDSLGQSNLTKNNQISVTNEYYNGDTQSAFSILRNCRRRGKEYYENLCMKAVNQSIGRAIRHINDYAAILLVDKRYAFDSLQRSLSHPTNKLPQWIKDSFVSASDSYGQVHRLLHQFFKFNQKKHCL
ncbi:hypothetical protein K2173_024650 [Erythroxylum novogranatense]|uniref:Helicase ATP-binding domain-containing protein n=1 Tax=Erythroxylum novogranatense TaxID=1862640 RepID=A0AAV8SV70_9ROSI|nr:hypothetical protein K2173_024650 [Erythroxylum novogranatense]